jgi:hypothetical protein
MKTSVKMMRLTVELSTGVTLVSINTGAYDFLKNEPVFMWILFHSRSSRPALGPTDSLIQWVTEALSPAVKRPWREANHSPQTTTEVKNKKVKG